MTFNIRLSKAPDGPNAWPRREAMVRDLIRQYQADFVGVQEAWPDQIAYLRDNLTDYSYLVRSREVDAEQGEAVPLFYRQARWKLDDAERGTFWLSDTPQVPGSKSWGNGIPRIATWGRFVEKATGRALYVFNVHFDHLSESSRVASAALLVQRAARPPPSGSRARAGRSQLGRRRRRAEAPRRQRLRASRFADRHLPQTSSPRAARRYLPRLQRHCATEERSTTSSPRPTPKCSTLASGTTNATAAILRTTFPCRPKWPFRRR